MKNVAIQVIAAAAFVVPISVMAKADTSPAPQATVQDALNRLNAGQTAAPPGPPPPPAPPVIEVPPIGPGMPARVLITWSAGPVRCDGVVRTPTVPINPYPLLGWRNIRSTSGDVAIDFAIDASGRTMQISGDMTNRAYAADLKPAVAVARFAAGAPAQNCRVTLSLQNRSLEEVPIAEVARYAAGPRNGPVEREVIDRLKPTGTDCFDPRLEPRVIYFPDLKSLPAQPGQLLWSLAGFDVDATGKTVRTGIIASAGNAAIDKAVLAAITKSRFAPVSRHGCLSPHTRPVDRLAAPEFPPSKNPCDEPVNWRVPPRLQYPDAYRRRSVEGWALIRYDVAPWGAVGNFSVVASAPSDDFGTAGILTLRNAALPERASGMKGCLARVRFVIAPDGTPVSDPKPEIPAPF